MYCRRNILRRVRSWGRGIERLIRNRCWMTLGLIRGMSRGRRGWFLGRKHFRVVNVLRTWTQIFPVRGTGNPHGRRIYGKHTRTGLGRHWRRNRVLIWSIEICRDRQWRLRWWWWVFYGQRRRVDQWGTLAMTRSGARRRRARRLLPRLISRR